MCCIHGICIFAPGANVSANMIFHPVKHLAKCEASKLTQNLACELGNAIGTLTTIWQKFRWHTDGILITVEKFRVRTHHNMEYGCRFVAKFNNI